MPAPALAPPETSGSDGSDGQRPGHARASHLKEVLRVMIHGLPVDLEIPFVDGIRGAHAAFLSSCGIPVPRAAMFGGSGVASHALTKISEVWREAYGIELTFQTTVFAEKDSDKLLMAKMQQVAGNYAVKLAEDVCKPSARNEITGLDEMVPAFSMIQIATHRCEVPHGII